MQPSPAASLKACDESLPNPFDPVLREDLGTNEKNLLHFMSDCMHGYDMSLVDRYVAEDYLQHTPGSGMGATVCANTWNM